MEVLVLFASTSTNGFLMDGNVTTHAYADSTSTTAAGSTVVSMTNISNVPTRIPTSAHGIQRLTTTQDTQRLTKVHATQRLTTAGVAVPTIMRVTPVTVATSVIPVTTYSGNRSTTPLIEVCEDTLDTCQQYGHTPCTQKIYEPWAKAHCAMFCGFCAPPIPLQLFCQNKVQNCAEYDSGDLCTAGSFYGWAYENCKGYCKFDMCNGSWCEDSVEANCPLLDVAIDICHDIPKAKAICKKHCNLCNVIDGEWCSWGEWSNCDVTCENGTQVRTRQCSCPVPKNGGLPCGGTVQDVKTCSLEPCPVHGQWSGWSGWGSCSLTCGIGIRQRDRHCNNPYPDRFGDHCFGESMRYDVCAGDMCTNGNWTSWGHWSVCSRTCGVGMRRRERSCSVSNILLQKCVGDRHETEICTSIPCDAHVRLINGRHQYEGRLEVYHTGTWGTVCDDVFNDNAARVVCKMLNFPWATARAFPKSSYGPGSLPILLDDVSCSGSELSLYDCAHRAWGSHNCSHSHDVAVSCIPKLHVRLVGGNSSRSGRVEVSADGSHWGTVCRDIFYSTTNGAKVVCKMLGHPTTNASVTSASGGSGPIFLDDVHCTGLETTLLACNHAKWGTENCNHSEDVAVTCG